MVVVCGIGMYWVYLIKAISLSRAISDHDHVDRSPDRWPQDMLRASWSLASTSSLAIIAAWPSRTNERLWINRYPRVN